MLPISKLRRRCLVGVLGLWLGAVPVVLRGQDAADSFLDEVEIRDVRVDVVVSGDDDYPILGLTQEDFELLVDGQPTPVTQFIAFESDTALRVEGSSRGRRTSLYDEERLFVSVLVDRTFLAPGDLEDTTELLREFLTTLRPRDRVMLVTADPRLELLERFEEGPPAAILATLDDLVDSPGSGRPFLTDYRDLLDDLGPVRTYGTQAQHRAKATLARVEAFAAEGQQRMERVAANLHQVIGYTAGLPGRRVILYVGGHIPIGLGQDLLTAWEQSYGESSPLARLPESEGGLDADSESMLFKTPPRVPNRGADRELFADIGRHANLAQAVLLPVDATGQGSSPAFTSKRGLQRFGGSSAFGGAASLMFADLARATGGQVLDRVAFEYWAGHPLAQQLANFYRLSFSPPEGSEAAEYRIEIRLRKPQAQVDVRHPAAVTFPSLDQEAIDRVRAAVVLGAEHNVLGIDVKVLELEHVEVGTKARLKVRIPLPNLAMVPSGEHHFGRLTVFVLSASWDGTTSSPIKAILPIRLSREELMASLAGPVELTVEVLLPRGADSVGVGVRDHFASVFSTTVAQLSTGATVPTALSQ